MYIRYIYFIIVYLFISKLTFSACPSTCSVSELDGRQVLPGTTITLQANVAVNITNPTDSNYYGIWIVYSIGVPSVAPPANIQTMVGIGTPDNTPAYWNTYVSCINTNYGTFAYYVYGGYYYYMTYLGDSSVFYDSSAAQSAIYSNAGISSSLPLTPVVNNYYSPITYTGGSKINFSIPVGTTLGTKTIWAYQTHNGQTGCVTAKAALQSNPNAYNYKAIGTLTVAGCTSFTDNTTQMASFDTTYPSNYATVGSGTSACASGRVAPNTVRRYCQSNSTWQSYQASDGICYPGVVAGGVMIWF